METVLVLDEESRPLELQNCHPNGKSRFVLRMTPGVPVRIYDYCVCPQVCRKLWSNRQLVMLMTHCREALEFGSPT